MNNTDANKEFTGDKRLAYRILHGDGLTLTERQRAFELVIKAIVTEPAPAALTSLTDVTIDTAIDAAISFHWADKGDGGEGSPQEWVPADFARVLARFLAETRARAERYALALRIAGIDPEAKPHPCDGDNFDAARRKQ